MFVTMKSRKQLHCNNVNYNNINTQKHNCLCHNIIVCMFYFYLIDQIMSLKVFDKILAHVLFNPPLEPRGAILNYNSPLFASLNLFFSLVIKFYSHTYLRHCMDLVDFINGEPTLLVHCLYQMSPLNRKKTTSSLAPPIFYVAKNR